MRLTVVNLRPATGKTTVALRLAERLGRDARTLLVDADRRRHASAVVVLARPAGVETLALATRDVHRRLAEVAREFVHVVIDTPPEDAAIVASCVLATGHALVPATASPGDTDDLDATLDLLRRMGALAPIRMSLVVGRGTDRAAPTPPGDAPASPATAGTLAGHPH